MFEEICKSCLAKGDRVVLVYSEGAPWVNAIWPPRIEMKCPKCDTTKIKICLEEIVNG